MTNEQAAYVACAIDGEGTITVGQHLAMCRVQISVFNTCLPFLEWIGKAAKTGTITPHSKPKEKQVWCWRVQNEADCTQLLKEVSPYMIIKRKQAVLALAILELTVPRDYEADSSKKYDSQLRQAALAAKLKALNQGEQK